MTIIQDEWIEWNGGECPVAPETPVEVKFRNGRTNALLPAAIWGWRHMDQHNGYDIIAYKVVKEGEGG